MKALFSTLKHWLTPTKRAVQSKEQKCEEIICSYQARLKAALAPLRDDPKKFHAKKSELLRDFSVELSRNIFFDHDEMREIIRGLAELECC